jgi:hypothetical protein
MPPWSALSGLLPVLERHLRAYADTAAADAALWARDLRRRILAGAIALAGALLCVMLASAWIIVAVWNTSARNPVLGAMLCTFLLCAIAGATLATRPFKPGDGPFARLRQELGTDQALLGSLSGPERLDQTRREAQTLLTPGGTGSDVQRAFPRSIVMRLLLNWTGLSRLFE